MKRQSLIGVAVTCSLVWITGCAHSRAQYSSAEYHVEQADGVIEVRRYAPQAIVDTIIMDNRRRRQNSGFRRLFRYISGQNTASQKIAMTVPVFMGEYADDYRMAFVLPATIGRAPEPNDASLRVRPLPFERVAAIRFSGRLNERAKTKQEAQLREWLVAHDIDACGPAWTAVYDPPWTLGMFRHNEVLIAVADPGSEK